MEQVYKSKIWNKCTYVKLSYAEVKRKYVG